ncbi:putative aldo keto reductase protein [Eutypa lata UCREL1]|uniref:Putative aldo keto reductase protein n=1 Tax=Eutypa lata (strain UCR-EL1) TaxID=1287681 RepID=M7T881_EUTLA|nr:putative aldo keto reductase protein [Eutypa lata UCREL1]
MGYTILGREVGPIGYGLMGLTWSSTTQSTEEEKIAIMKAALEAGANAWNGGEFYGTSVKDNSLTLLKKYFDKYPEDADKVSINIKGGIRFPLTTDNSPAYIRESVENSIGLLEGKAKIDMFEMARRTTQTEYLDSLRLLDSFAKEGKIGGVALSEVNANTIRQAMKITKVAAVEVEISLWVTDALKNGVCAACAEFGIPIFAYSPLAHGILTGKIKSFEDFPEGSFGKMRPRNQDKYLKANLKLVEKVEEWAAKKNCTPAQFAINWVASLSKRPGMPIIIPIPGAGRLERARENSKVVELTNKDMDEVDAYLKDFTHAGDALNEHMLELTDKNQSTEI